MDYLLNEYFFKYVPLNFEEETKKNIVDKAVTLVRIADWTCKAQDYRKLYDNHSSFFLAEIVFVILSLMTLVHAIRHGGRYIYTWIGIVIFSTSSELFRISYNKEWDYIFHAQSLLTLFGMRIPLHVVFGVLPTFIYSSYILSARTKLPFPMEAAAAGLIHALLYLPYSIVGTKLLWFQWHEWHPISSERNYFDVPLNEYFIQSFSVMSFFFLLGLLRRVVLDKAYDWKLFAREFGVVLFAGCTAIGFTISTFDHFIYYLHSSYGLSYFTIVTLYFAVLINLIYSYDRINNYGPAKIGNPFWFDEIAAIVIFSGFVLISLSLVGDPINTVSEGLHQPIGSCKETDVFKKEKYQKYVCPINMDIKSYDFHCLPGRNPPQQVEKDVPLEWYAICGTNYKNKAEFVFTVASIVVVTAYILYQFAAKSGETEYDEFVIHPRTPVKPKRQVERQTSSDVDESSESNVSESRMKSTKRDLITPSYEAQYFSRKKLHGTDDDDATPKKAPGTVSMELSRSRSRDLPISAKRHAFPTKDSDSSTPKRTTQTLKESQSLHLPKKTSSIAKSSSVTSPIGIGTKSLRSRRGNSKASN
uniref:Transmembrane protein n=1 Tax=Parastrongyloides trichosuri TaxID=131310 RepID=A0A0N4ZAJ8_PARTI